MNRRHEYEANEYGLIQSPQWEQWAQYNNSKRQRDLDKLRIHWMNVSYDDAKQLSPRTIQRKKSLPVSEATMLKTVKAWTETNCNIEASLKLLGVAKPGLLKYLRAARNKGLLNDWTF